MRHFLQTDPVGYEDDLNLYQYVGNDPINRSDPTGMRTPDDDREAARQNQRYIPPLIVRPEVSIAQDRDPNPDVARVSGGTREERAVARGAIENVTANTSRGRDMAGVAIDRGQAADVRLNSQGANNVPGGDTNRVNLDLGNAPTVFTTAGPEQMSPEAVVAHEFGHEFMGGHDAGPNAMDNVNANENPVRRELGEPERLQYYN